MYDCETHILHNSWNFFFGGGAKQMFYKTHVSSGLHRATYLMFKHVIAINNSQKILQYQSPRA